MRGRFREICQGVNVDLGTAAAFREQWQREAASPRLVAGTDGIELLLKTDQAPGDAVAMTAAIYSLHTAHPGKYVTAVESAYPEVFEYNPHVTPIQEVLSAAPVQMHYPAIHQSNDRGIHFMQGWCEFLGAALRVHIPLLTDRPRLYFDPHDYDNPPIGNYWVICSGGKSDFTAKLWGHDKYQDVVNELRDVVQFIQIGAFESDHPPLRGVLNAVGKTSLRGLFHLIRCARGIVCGVSLAMHVAAALDRPAIVLAGGREPVAWNAYPKQHYLHTIGALSCTSTQGHVGRACWRSRTLPLGDNAYLDRQQNLCERPVLLGEPDPTPACMTLISPTEVAELVRRYNSQYTERNNGNPAISR